jgi:E3 SUMO-protein ligase NSE2
MERSVAPLMMIAEQALRDLIDYGDELAMKDTIMKEVIEN